MAWLVAWTVLGVISVNFLASVYGKYHRVYPEAYALFWTRQGWLWTHLAGGAVTVVLGPLQFLTRWPRTWLRLHRWTGRAYAAGMAVGLTGAIGLIASSPAPMEIRGAFTSTALAWATTGGIALAAIYRGHVETHRRWMIRNYLVTLAPISFRFALQGYIAMGLMPSAMAIATMLWLSWAVPLVVYEAIRRIQRRGRGR